MCVKKRYIKKLRKMYNINNVIDPFTFRQTTLRIY